MGDLQNLRKLSTDFLIIGSGIAGLYTALKLSRLGSVTIITKESLEESNTQYAQGGIAAVIDNGDSLQFHLEDTLQAGAGISNREAVRVLVTEGPDRVQDLIKLGTKFDQIEGELDLTREGAHSKRRILHARGDATGKEIRESLSAVVAECDNIVIRENTFMIDLTLARDNPSRVSGALVRDNDLEEYIIFQASAVIMAAGGCGRVYASTSNPEVTTGDGIAAGFRAGARIIDMEFVQFHPTTYYNPEGPSFLISESVRGEGGILRNSKGERFMPGYHKLAELAPRDVVARAIIAEVEADKKPYVWLDVTQLKGDYIKERFPTIYNTLRGYGLDMTRDLIPVIPAAHYLMGGIKTDLYGRTNLNGLYACGEVACTGVHGANRLASNSLLEGLVFGYRIYRVISDKQNLAGTDTEGKQNSFNTDITDNSTRNNKVTTDNFIPGRGIPMQTVKTGVRTPALNKYTDFIPPDIKEISQELRNRMMKSAGIIRDKADLHNLLTWLEEKSDFISNYVANNKIVNQEFLELDNMLTVARLITMAALKRKESRGGHYRVDYSEQKANWTNIHIIFDADYPEGKKYACK